MGVTPQHMGLTPQIPKGYLEAVAPWDTEASSTSAFRGIFGPTPSGQRVGAGGKGTSEIANPGTSCPAFNASSECEVKR